MKRLITLLAACALLICAGCTGAAAGVQVAATTLPVYEFTARLCQGTGIRVARLVNENVSCLHDYSLNVNQVRTAESAQVIVTSGAGLEEFMADLLTAESKMIDSSEGVELLCGEHHHEEGEHHHENDPHIWLSPENAKVMAQNIARELALQYPEHAGQISGNLKALLADLDALQAYGEAALGSLSCKELITFHDGFAYFAASFGLTILEAVEEESGSEASAAELIHLTQLVREHDLPAVFTERNGSTAAAQIIAAESGAKVYSLDMAMSGDSYLNAMYHNIDTIKEALG